MADSVVMGWSNELQKIIELSSFPNMTSLRAVRVLEADLLHSNLEGEKNLPNKLLAEARSLRRNRVGEQSHRLAVSNNRYTVIPSGVNNEAVLPAVVDMIDDQTEAVVELGCGYGRHLIALRDLIEHKFGKLKYIGGEISENALKAANVLKGLEPGRTNLNFHQFDFTRPSLDFLSGYQNIVFFTCHALEQVKCIEENFFDAVLASAHKVQCIHCEPVGWQMNENVIREIENESFITRHKSSELGVFKEVDDFISAYVPITCGWNRNLISQLADLEARGKIMIEFYDRNYAGNQPYNPSTLIGWSKP